MQQGNDATDPLITPAAAAKALGLNRSTIHRQIKTGLIHTHQGLVRLSEVKARRKANIDPERSHRAKLAKRALPQPLPGATKPLPGNNAAPDATSPAGGIGLRVLDHCDNAFDQGAMTMGMILTYRIGRIDAVMAIESGAPCKVAFAVEKSVTWAVMREIVAFGQRQQIGPFARNDDPDVWQPEFIEETDWKKLAKVAGELVDMPAWEAFLKERFGDDETPTDEKSYPK